MALATLRSQVTGSIAMPHTALKVLRALTGITYTMTTATMPTKRMPTTTEAVFFECKETEERERISLFNYFPFPPQQKSRQTFPNKTTKRQEVAKHKQTNKQTNKQ